MTGFADAVSPFHWAGGAGVLVHGVAWSSMLALAVRPVVLLIGAYAAVRAPRPNHIRRPALSLPMANRTPRRLVLCEGTLVSVRVRPSSGRRCGP